MNEDRGTGASGPPDGGATLTGAARALPPSGSAPLAPIPDWIAGYRVIGLLGAGGMGVVYEAEQQSPKRRVAIKIIRGGALDDESFRAFQLEAASLARLDHPGIGAIHESGVDASGHPFLAMEFVRGETLSATIARTPPRLQPEDVRMRVALVARIADAVHYAHQRGVIHRDLKPSNIVVVDDAPLGDDSSHRSDAHGALRSPRIKILDFGLARIVEPDADVTVTAVGTVKGTLAYMSPEQARGASNEIDTRTDVYSLGVILYELLTGRRPYDVPTGSIVEAAKTICETKPRLLQDAWRGRRKPDPDLETIVATALRKQPENRYASAAGLALDLQRYLAFQPIAARPASTAYQLRKAIARNKAVFAISTALAVITLVAAVTSTVLFFRAEREAERARAEASESQVVATFLTRALGGVGAGMTAEQDRGVMREALDRAAARIDEEYQDAPGAQASIHLALGRVYRELTVFGPAEEHIRAALAIREQTVGELHPGTIEAQQAMGELYYYNHRSVEAVAFFRRVLLATRRTRGNDHPETLEAEANMGAILVATNDLENARDILTTTLEGQSALYGTDDPSTLNTRYWLGDIARRLGRFDEAEEHLRAVCAGYRRSGSNGQKSLVTPLGTLALVVRHQGRMEEAEALYRETAAIAQELFGDKHELSIAAEYNLAALLAQLGRLEEAEALWLPAFARAEDLYGTAHGPSAVAGRRYASHLLEHRRFEDAERQLLAAHQVLPATTDPEHDPYALVVQDLVRLYEAWGRPEDAAVWRDKLSGGAPPASTP